MGRRLIPGLVLCCLLLLACAGPAAYPTPTVAGVRDARDALRPTPAPTPTPVPEVPPAVGCTREACWWLVRLETRADGTTWAVYRRPESAQMELWVETAAFTRRR